jgi:hypothetical protein
MYDSPSQRREKVFFIEPGSKYMMVSVTTNQVCCYSTKTAMDDIAVNEHGCVPIKLYL